MKKLIVLLAFLVSSCGFQVAFTRSEVLINGVPTAGEVICDKQLDCLLRATTFCGFSPCLYKFSEIESTSYSWNGYLKEFVPYTKIEYSMLFKCF